MARKPHHPPEPGAYAPPSSATPGYIVGENAVAGFGAADFYVAAIPCREANEIMVRHHYCHSFCICSYVHIGIYLDGQRLGALQFGYNLRPGSCDKVVAGTDRTEYLELNRMWLDDAAPRNSESRALSYALKYIRRAMPWVKWIQSFADERCNGGVGIVYQAAGFDYLGMHRSPTWELDGEFYHNILVGFSKKPSDKRGAYLVANLHRAKRRVFRRYRYWRPLKPRCRKYLKFKVRPHPKPDQSETSCAARR